LALVVFALVLLVLVFDDFAFEDLLLAVVFALVFDSFGFVDLVLAFVVFALFPFLYPTFSIFLS
jgi:hypothetical protein